MPGVINQDGEALTWTAVYWRYHSRYEQECDSLDEAVRFLEYGEDDGSLSSEAIFGPNGKLLYEFGSVLNGTSIWDLAERLREERDQADAATGTVQS